MSDKPAVPYVNPPFTRFHPPFVNKRCEACSAIILTRAGTLRWCSKCRKEKYAEAQMQSKARAIKREKARKLSQSVGRATDQQKVYLRGVKA